MLIIAFVHSYADVNEEEGRADGQYGQGTGYGAVHGERDGLASDDSDDGHELGETGEDDDRDGDEAWETSSTESRSLLLPPNYWAMANRLPGVCHKPSEVRTFMGHMTVPHLKALCSLWHLPKTGNKAALLARLYDRLMDAPDSPIGISDAKCDHKLVATKSPSRPGDAASSPDANKTLRSPSSPATSIPRKRSGTGRDATTPICPSYSVLLSQLNDEYARYNSSGWRPFQLPPVTIGGESLRLLEGYDWDYTLPYPWILERKLSPPVMIGLLREIAVNTKGGDSINIEVARPNHAGARLLLVAIKYCNASAGASEEEEGTGDEHGEDINVTSSSVVEPSAGRPRTPWPPKEYRHAYIRDFQCTFDGLHYGGGRYETSTVHQVTSYLTGSSASGRPREPTALWTLRLDLLPPRMTRPPTASPATRVGRTDVSGRSLVGGDFPMCSSSSYYPPLGGSGYFLQIVSARRDPEEWLRLHQRSIKVRPASQVMAQIRRDFYSSSKHGISTSAIRISLRCPLSLQRMVTPVRSRRCRHPQCWELESSLTSFSAGRDHQHPLSAYEQEPPIYRCPVCDVSVAPDALFVDGLAREMLSDCSQADEVIIDTELGTWRALGDEWDHRSFASSPSVACSTGEETGDLGEEATALAEKSAERPRPKSRSRSRSTLSIVDLTVTPDESIDPTLVAAVYFKTDPGIVGGGNGRTLSGGDGGGREGGTPTLYGVADSMTVVAPTPPRIIADNVIDLPHPAVMLEEADVVQSEAWYLTAPPTGSGGDSGTAARPPLTTSHGQRRGGTSAFDAIIID